MRVVPRLRRPGARRGQLSVAFLVLNLDGMGGTSRSAITQANALSRRGHQVRLVSVTRSADAPHYPIDAGVAVDHLLDVRSRSDGQPGPRPSALVPARWDGQFDADMDAVLREHLPRLEADVLVTVTPALLSLAVQLAPADVAVVHQEHRSSADRVGGMEPLLAFAPRADTVALLTESAATWLAHELGPVAPQLVVMPNPLPQTPQPRSALDSRTIVSAGRIVAEKQFIHLVRAFAEIADARPGWRLRILGEGPLRGELAAYAAKAGLADRVELPGAVSDMAAEWAAASVCALTSRTEGLPLVIQEAMSAGVPAVTYDCPSGPRELVEHDVSGLLVAAGAKAGLTAALSRITGDETLLRRLGEGAHRSSLQYDADAVAARWEPILRQAVARHGSGEPTSRWPHPHTRERGGTASPDSSATPEQARASAFATVVQAAEAAGPGWFVIPEHERFVPTVVVPATRRTPFLEALQAPEHLSLRDPGDRGWPERRLPVPEMVAVQRRAMTPRLVLEPWPRGDGGRRTHLGEHCGVEIEFWDPADDGTLVAPRPNAHVQRAGPPDTTVRVLEREVPSYSLATGASVDECRFPVDVVYTWVDGDDDAWNAAREARLGEVGSDHARRESSGRARFRSRDELRHSMRSVDLFAPWVRTIHLVTAGQRPTWLADHPKVRVVDHRDILPEDALPTFSSQAIETALHRVPDLAEHFVYLNDDVFLGRPVRPELFFSPGGDVAAFVSDGLIGEPGPDAKPFLQAALNNRRLLQEAFGVTITHVMAHSPHPHRVSVLREIEARFGAAVGATARAPFRSAGDVSLLSSLAQHYGLVTGTAFRGAAAHAFVDLANARIERQLRQLRARDNDFFCVGDHHDFAVDADEVDALLAEFLEAYFPVAAPWERGS